VTDRTTREVKGATHADRLGPDDLVFCAGTLLKHGLRDVVAAASAGGFRAVSLWPHHVEGASASGLSDADLRRLLADEGLVALEVEPVMSWLPETALDASARRLVGPAPEAFFALAERVGARSLLAVDGFGARAERAVLVDAFAALCEGARRHGLSVKLEFTPWSAIPDAASAAEIVRASGAVNAGILIDSWHHFRGANDLSQIAALPGDLVHGVQLNDASAAPTGEPLPQESMHARRLPGEGQIDLVGLLRTLDRIGCRAPLGAEVFSDAFDGHASAEVGRRVGDSMRALVAKARG
jgi:sugar phosphate isomerase/epimerase